MSERTFKICDIIFQTAIIILLTIAIAHLNKRLIILEGKAIECSSVVGNVASTNKVENSFITGSGDLTSVRELTKGQGIVVYVTESLIITNWSEIIHCTYAKKSLDDSCNIISERWKNGQVYKVEKTHFYNQHKRPLIEELLYQYNLKSNGKDSVVVVSSKYLKTVWKKL